MSVTVASDIREQAAQRFAQLGWPSTKLEEWKYTNVAPISRVDWRFDDVGRVLNPSAAEGGRSAAADGLRTRPTLALESAYRAFAAGDVRKSDELLSDILAANASAEAYLLRGCARYTQAMLSRKPEALLSAAAEDFRAALRLNRALRLDRSAFSPKLVAYFDQVRGSS